MAVIRPFNVYFATTEEPLNGISGNSYIRTVYPSEKSRLNDKCPYFRRQVFVHFFEGINSYHKINLNLDLNFFRDMRHTEG